MKTTKKMRNLMVTLLTLIVLVTSINPVQLQAASSDPVERIWFVGNYDKSAALDWYDGMRLTNNHVAKIGLVVQGQTKSGKIKPVVIQVKEVGQYLSIKNGKVKLTIYCENAKKTLTLKVGVKTKKIALKATGVSLYEGQLLTEAMSQKVATANVSYSNGKTIKKSKAVVCQQIGKTIRANSKGKFKLTYSLGGTKKSIFIKVKPIKHIYIGKTKILRLVEKNTFLKSNFKDKTTVKVVYTNGIEKTLKTYSVSAAKKVTGKKFYVTVKYGKFSDKIAIPVVKQYKISVVKATGGTVTIDKKVVTSKTVIAGTKVTVVAAPKPGYQFTGWFVNNKLVSKSLTYTVKVTKNVTVKPSFVKKEEPPKPTMFTISVDKEGKGGAEFIGYVENKLTIEKGTKIQVKATPAEGFIFAGWKINGVYDKNAPSTIIKTVSSNMSFIAVFEEKPAEKIYHTLTVKSMGMVKLNGKAIQFNDGMVKFTIANGEKVILTAEDTERLLFANWLLNGQHVDSTQTGSYEFVMKEDVEVEAVFYEWYHVDIKNQVEGGTVSIANGPSDKGLAAKGQRMTLTAHPKQNYQFLNWTDSNGNILGEDLTLVHEVTGDIVIRPVFKKIEYMVTIEGLGDMQLDGKTETSKMVSVGETITVNYIDSEHFKFLRWEDKNGNMVSLEKEYSFVVTENTCLTAVVDEHYKLSAKTTNGLIKLDEEDVTGTEKYYKKGSYKLVLTLNEGYQLVAWNDSEGNDLGSELELEVELDADTEITAVTEKIRCKLVVSENTGGKITINGNDATERTYSYGTDVTLNTTANPGYKFVRWVDKITGETLSENKEYTFSIKSDREIIPVFDRVHTVTITRKGRGTVKFNGEALDFHKNEASVTVSTGRYTIETEENDDYYFVKYIISGEEITKSSYSVAVSTEVAIEVNFAERIKTARVSYQNPANTQVYVSGEVTRGETLAPPNDKDKIVRENHTFEGWSLNDVVYKGQVGDDEFYADEQHSLSDAIKALTKDGTDVVVYAYFVPIKDHFTVSVKGGTVRTVSADDGIVDGTVEVEINSKVSISANVPEGKCFSHWEDSNGNYLHNLQDFTVDRVTANMDYVAIFSDTEPEREPMVYFMAKDGVKGYKGEGSNWYFHIACNIPDDGRFSKIEWGLVVASKISSDDELIAHASNVNTNTDGNPDTQTALSASCVYRIPFNANWISQKRTVRLKVYADIQPKDGESFTIYSEECLHVDFSKDDPQIESF